jgi:hypothetical protein
MADLVADERLSAQYRKLAETYDGLADNELRVAKDQEVKLRRK